MSKKVQNGWARTKNYEPAPIEPPLIIHIRGIIGPERGEIERYYQTQLRSPVINRDQSLRKLTHERRCINASANANNAIRTSIGLPPISFSKKMFLIMLEIDFDDVFPELTKNLAVVNGKNIYIVRNSDKPLMLHTTTHETHHLFSCARYAVTVSKGGPNGEKPEVICRQMRSGLIGPNSTCVGINEAVTEMLTYAALKEMLDMDTGIPHKIIKQAMEFKAYIGEQLILERLSAEHFGEKHAAMPLLIWDYYTGTADFLRELKRKAPDMVEPIRAMKASDKSALQTAQILGYKEEAKEIREVIKFKKRKK